MTAPRRGGAWRLASTFIADPPWKYGDAIDAAMGRRGAATQYKDMTVGEILNVFPRACEDLRVRVAADALLFLWFTNAFAEEAHQVARRWGFAPKTIVTWIKGRLVVDVRTIGTTKLRTRERIVPDFKAEYDITPRLIQQIGQGHYFQNSTEHVLVAARGSAMIDAARRVPSAFVAPRPRLTVGGASKAIHSAKPDAFCDIVERVAAGPYVELFSRRNRPGWLAWGDEVGKLDQMGVAR